MTGPHQPVTGDWTREEQDGVLGRLGYNPRTSEEAAEAMRSVAAQTELKRLRATPPLVKAYLLTAEARPAGLFTSPEKAFTAAEARQHRITGWTDVNKVAEMSGDRLWYSAGWTGYTVHEMDVQ